MFLYTSAGKSSAVTEETANARTSLMPPTAGVPEEEADKLVLTREEDVAHLVSIFTRTARKRTVVSSDKEAASNGGRNDRKLGGKVIQLIKEEY